MKNGRILVSVLLIFVLNINIITGC